MSIFQRFRARSSLVPAVLLLLTILPWSEAQDAPLPIFGAARKAVENKETVDTRLVGFSIGQDYREVRTEGAVLIGFEFGLGKAGNNDVIYALKPIFGSAKGEIDGARVGLFTNFNDGKKVIKTKVTKTYVVKARPGYCVGGITVQGGLVINAMSVQFMAIDGSQLNPKNTYSSDWVGDRTGNDTVLDGKGAPVLGITGKKNDNHVCCVGLVLVKPKAAAVEPPPIKPRPQPKPPEDVEVPAPEPAPQPAKPQELLPSTPVPMPTMQESTPIVSIWILVAVFGLVTVPILVLALVLARRHDEPRAPVKEEPPPDRHGPKPIPSAEGAVPITPDVLDQSAITTEPRARAPLRRFGSAITATEGAMEPVAPVAPPVLAEKSVLSRGAGPQLVLSERVGFGPRLAAQLIDGVAIVMGGLVAAMIGALLGIGAGATFASEFSKGLTPPPGVKPAPAQVKQSREAQELMKSAGGVFGGIFGGLVAFGFGMNVMGLGFFLWEAQTGAALGKRLLKIRIRSENGGPAEPQQLYLRSAFKYSARLISLVALIPGLGLLGFFSPLAGFVVFVGCFFVLAEARQALHDMAAKTAVYPVGQG
jgi:uncharacterized RDD family membrane protein YckC